MHAIVAAALKQRILVGLLAYNTLSIEAYPAPVPRRVEVLSAVAATP